MQVRGQTFLSLIGGLILAASQVASAANLSESGYPLNARNQSKPADFYAKMAKAVKIDKAAHGCFFASRSEIFAFDDAVVYTDANKNNFNSYVLDTVTKKGCSVPGTSLLVNAPSDRLQPVALNKQVVADGSIAYNTVSLAASGIVGLNLNQKEIVPGSTSDFIKKVRAGIQVTQAQFACRDIKSSTFTDAVKTRPFIYVFLDGVILTEFDGSTYDVFDSASVSASGCKVPATQPWPSTLVPIDPTPETNQPLASLRKNLEGSDFSLGDFKNLESMDVPTYEEGGQKLDTESLGCTISKYPFAYIFEDGILFTNDVAVDDVYPFELSTKATALTAGCKLGTSTKPLASLKKNLDGSDFTLGDFKNLESMDVPTYEEGGVKVKTSSLGCNVSKYPFAYIFEDGILFTNDVAADDVYPFELLTKTTALSAGCKLGNAGEPTPVTPNLPSSALSDYVCSATPSVSNGLIGPYATGAFEVGQLIENRAFAFVAGKAQSLSDTQRGIDIFSAKAALLQGNLTLLPDVHFAANLSSQQLMYVGNFAGFLEISLDADEYIVREFGLVVDFGSVNSKPQVRLKNEYRLKKLMSTSFNPWKQDFESNRIETVGFGVLHNAQGELDVVLKYPRAKATILVNGAWLAPSVDKVKSIAKQTCEETWTAIRYSGEPIPYCNDAPTILNGSVQQLDPVNLGARVDKQFSAPSCSAANTSVKPSGLVGTYETRPFGNEFGMLNEQNSGWEPYAFYRQYFVLKTKAGADKLADLNTAYRYILASKTSLTFDYEQELAFSVGEAYVIGYIENGALYAIALEQPSADKFIETVINSGYKTAPSVSMTNEAPMDWANDVNMYLRSSAYGDGVGYKYFFKLYSTR